LQSSGSTPQGGAGAEVKKPVLSVERISILTENQVRRKNRTAS